jgi:hypothetical protein
MAYISSSIKIYVYTKKKRYDLCKSQLNLNIITTCVCIYGKMLVYIITIHVQWYIHRGLWLEKSFASYIVIFILLSDSYMNIQSSNKKKESERFVYYQLILISWMNTDDNLCNLLTVIISERRCFNDEKKTNDEGEKHLYRLRWDIFVVVVVEVSLTGK